MIRFLEQIFFSASKCPKSINIFMNQSTFRDCITSWTGLFHWAYIWAQFQFKNFYQVLDGEQRLTPKNCSNRKFSADTFQIFINRMQQIDECKRNEIMILWKFNDGLRETRVGSSFFRFTIFLRRNLMCSSNFRNLNFEPFNRKKKKRLERYHLFIWYFVLETPVTMSINMIEFSDDRIYCCSILSLCMLWNTILILKTNV